MYGMVAIVINVYLNFAKRVDSKCPYHTHTQRVTIWGEGCVNKLDNVYLYQIIMLYSLNIYNFCQSYLGRAGGKNELWAISELEVVPQ